MKTYLTKILALTSILSAFAVTAYGTTIESVPFTITTSGTYKLDGDLVLAGTNQTAITVNVSNVVIDLNGFAITTSQYPNYGIVTSSTATNVTIQNGTLSGFFNSISLAGGQALVQALRLINDEEGIQAASSCTSSVIQNCFIAGGAGIGVTVQGSSIVVKNNQILSEQYGGTSGGNNSFVANYVGNCSYGLYMTGSDKYQANVTNECTTPFTGGIAVGDANN